MKKRFSVNRRSGRKLFTKTADRSNGRNFRPAPMRGGIRL